MTRAAAAALMDQVAERLAEFKRLEEAFGPEPAEGAMLRIFRVLADQTYTYAAIRADNGSWYLTGRYGHRARTWDEVLDLISGWTLRHYEVVPPPAGQILPSDAQYPCGHTDADHEKMFSYEDGSPLSFAEFPQKFPPPGAEIQANKAVPNSLADVFRSVGFPFSFIGTDGENSYDNEGSHVDEPGDGPSDPTFSSDDSQ